MQPQQPIDLIMGLARLLLTVALLALVAAAYSVVAAWTVRRYGLSWLALEWVVIATTLSAAIFWGHLSVVEKYPGLDTLVVTLALIPVLTSAGSSIFIWRLYKRRPEASALRFLVHGMVGFGVGFFAVLFTACVGDIVRFL